MAKTEFGVNDPLAVKVWSKSLASEAFKKTYIGKFIGKTEDSLVQEKVDLKKSAGDKITCGLNIQLNGDGVEGDATLEGSEEALQFYDDSVVINQLRHAAASKGKMSEQRVPYNMRRVCRDRLSDWWARRMETAFFNQICGNTVENRSVYLGHNSVVAPSTNRKIIQDGVADEQTLASGNTFTLDMIDAAVNRAKTVGTDESTGPQIRPIRHQGEDMYVMFIHPHQVFSLRTNTNSGQWLDIQKAAMQGGDVKKNPIFSGALGIYNNVILHESNYVTKGVNSSTGAAIDNVRRAVLCGAQAATIAFGSDNGVNRFNWVEEGFDYNNQLGVSAGCIWGLKKTKFIPADDSSTNAEDFGTIVLPSYAAAPSLA